MNKFLISSIICIIISHSLKGQCDIRMYDIYTPAGNPVVTFLMCESSLQTRQGFDATYAQTYPNAIQLNTYDNCSATRKFNCHGYAWLRVEQGIDRWIGTGWPNDVTDPEQIYMTDGSYIQISQATYPGKVSWGSGDHSAVTTSQSGVFISKWNEWPLMQHAWNYSPFGTSNLMYYKYGTSISGPARFCTSATYTVSIPPVNYTWSCSSNLTLSSASGNTATFTKNGNGTGWIRIVSNGSEIIRENVYVVTSQDEPSYENISIPTNTDMIIEPFIKDDGVTNYRWQWDPSKDSSGAYLSSRYGTIVWA